MSEVFRQLGAASDQAGPISFSGADYTENAARIVAKSIDPQPQTTGDPA